MRIQEGMRVNICMRMPLLDACKIKKNCVKKDSISYTKCCYLIFRLACVCLYIHRHADGTKFRKCKHCQIDK